MKKIGLIATREFVTTVGSKGFLFGLLIMPLLFVMVMLGAPRIMNARSPQIRGDVAVIDQTTRVTAELRMALDPETFAARRRANAQRALRASMPGAAQAVASNQTLQAAVGQLPALQLVERPASANVQHEKEWLGRNKNGEHHLALVVMHPDAVVRAGAGTEYGSYDLYVSPTLDNATENVLNEALAQALTTARLRASQLDVAQIEATMRVAKPASVIVAAGGEQQAQRGFDRALPFLLGVLLFIGVMIGGQTLMTSTIEEKSSRVVDVLLAAVSPFELMAGKLLGQLGVGLLVMAIYVGLGLIALFQFAMLGLLNPMLVVYLLIFFLITYVIFGATMMAIGAAVNQVADAQSLMGPVMLLLVAPYILAPMIARAPNSTFAVVLSFIPPVNTFVMLSRLASGTPPPAWQVLLTMLLGLLAAGAAVWFAGKVFKIGLLMHGKPPNFATLVRWARAA